jgi:hypothetical protein
VVRPFLEIADLAPGEFRRCRRVRKRKSYIHSLVSEGPVPRRIAARTAPYSRITVGLEAGVAALLTVDCRRKPPALGRKLRGTSHRPIEW